MIIFSCVDIFFALDKNLKAVHDQGRAYSVYHTQHPEVTDYVIENYRRFLEQSERPFWWVFIKDTNRKQSPQAVAKKCACNLCFICFVGASA